MFVCLCLDSIIREGNKGNDTINAKSLQLVLHYVIISLYLFICVSLNFSLFTECHLQYTDDIQFGNSNHDGNAVVSKSTSTSTSLVL